MRAYIPSSIGNMRSIIPVLHALAGLAGCSFLLSSAWLIVWLIVGRPDQSDGMTAFGDLIGVVMLLASFVIHGFFAVMCVVTAESIRFWEGKKVRA